MTSSPQQPFVEGHSFAWRCAITDEALALGCVFQYLVCRKRTLAAKAEFRVIGSCGTAEAVPPYNVSASCPGNPYLGRLDGGGHLLATGAGSE